jgi:putative FmdB family regulatory protein
MPVYEYECDRCKGHFEVEQRITEEPLKRCNRPKCQGEVHRVVPATSFCLKGAGWFKSGGY